MAVRMRLKRVGAKKKPSYRVVVADSRTARDGRVIEEIGYYNPRNEPPVIKIDAERAAYWLKTGATPSDRVRWLLKEAGIPEKIAEAPEPPAAV